jgi:glutamyl-tRNA reductase
MRTLRGLDAAPVIRAYRERVEAIRDETLARSMKQLEQGISPDKVLVTLARSLTSKLMHDPSVHLRDAAREGHSDMLALIRHLLDLRTE